MNRRFLLGPPKHRLPQTSGRRMRPISRPSAVQIVTPLYPTARPALLEHHTLPSASQRTPSGPHFTPSIVKSENRFTLAVVPLAFASIANMSPCPPGPVSPGPLPVLTTYSRLKSGENARPFGSGTCCSVTTRAIVPLLSTRYTAVGSSRGSG